MIKRILIILFIAMIINCTDNSQKKANQKGLSFLFLELVLLSKGQKEEGIVVDNKNGTLNYTYRLIETNGWIGNKVLVEKTILIRRCLIGQVYRPTQNDCQGTGTKDTVWGATRLQWCPTNDRSCEIDGKADPQKSPAAKACADDTLLGKKWRLVSIDDGFRAFSSSTNKIYYSEMERPSGLILVWSNEANSEASVYDVFSNGTMADKNNININILCTGAIS